MFLAHLSYIKSNSNIFRFEKRKATLMFIREAVIMVFVKDSFQISLTLFARDYRKQ